MSTPAAKPHPTTGGSVSAEKMIRRAHQLVTHAGIDISPSKVTRLVREYQHKVGARKEFDAYIADAIREAGEQRALQLAGQILAPEDKGRGPVRLRGRKSVSVDQQVGEAATWNVFVERHLPQADHCDLGIVPDSDHTEDMRSRKCDGPSAGTPRPSEPSTHLRTER